MVPPWQMTHTTRVVLKRRGSVVLMKTQAPTDGLGAGFAPRGSLFFYFDGVNGAMYENRGSRAWPIWRLLTTDPGPA